MLIGAALASATHASIPLKQLAFPAFILGLAANLFEPRGPEPGVLALGARSAISPLLLVYLASTSMMTGNVMQVLIDTVDVLHHAPARREMS